MGSREVDVDQRAERLQVQPFAGRVGGHYEADRRVSDGPLDVLPLDAAPFAGEEDPGLARAGIEGDPLMPGSARRQARAPPKGRVVVLAEDDAAEVQPTRSVGSGGRLQLRVRRASAERSMIRSRMDPFLAHHFGESLSENLLFDRRRRALACRAAFSRSKDRWRSWSRSACISVFMKPASAVRLQRLGEVQGRPDRRRRTRPRSRPALEHRQPFDPHSARYRRRSGPIAPPPPASPACAARCGARSGYCAERTRPPCRSWRLLTNSAACNCGPGR